MARRQGIYWMLTIPEEDFDDQTFELTEETRYVKGQLEQGDGGFRHYQILVIFKRKQSLVGVKRNFGDRAHCELSRSSASNDYVWKEDTRIGEPFEFGALPFHRNEPKDWDAIWESAKEGKVEEIPADVRIQHYRSIVQIAARYCNPQAMERVCHVFVGRTGTGKSRRAWDEAGILAYPKDPRSKFWDGYRDQEHVVMDEFRGDIALSHVLRWLDRYPCLVEIKGSSTCLVAKKVWITSNLHPRDWYPMADQQTVDALFRRLQIVEFE
jgi:hypothetical protein